MRLFLILFLFAAHSACAETRVAFVLGNSNYDHAEPLANPVNDATLIADTLKGLEFAVTRHENLGLREIGTQLSVFLDETRGADVTLFYFAGHGMQFEGQNYLLGTDARLETEFDIATNALNLSRVIELLERDSRAALVFIDACRDNPLANDFYRKTSPGTRALASRGLAPVGTRYEGAMITFAASPGQVAYDGIESPNSPFAEALARHLPTTNMEILSLMKRVIRDVRHDTAGLQVPMVTNDLVTEVYLAASAPDPARNVDPASEALRVAGSLPEGSARRSALEAIVAQYPETLSGELAAVLLRQIQLPSRTSAISTTDAGHNEVDALPSRAVDPQRAERELQLKRADHARLQALLRVVGQHVGPSDGLFGGRSRRALRQFQAAVSEPGHGSLTPRIIALLEHEAAKKLRGRDGDWQITLYRRERAAIGARGFDGIIAIALLRIKEGEVSLLRFSDVTNPPRRVDPNLRAVLTADGRLDLSVTVNYEPLMARSRVVHASFLLPRQPQVGDSFTGLASRLNATAFLEATLTKREDPRVDAD